MEIIVLLTVFLATVAGSISGIGGGVLIKPVMDATLSLSSSQISFMSGTTVLAMTVASLIRSRDEIRKMDRRGVFLGLGAAVGGVIGKVLFEAVRKNAGSSQAVSRVQNTVMVALTAAVFVYTLKKAYIKKKNINNDIFSSFAGIVLGILSSFLGIGGGPINLMVLSYFFSMDTKTAAFNSLLTIFFSQSLSFVSSSITGLPEVNWALLFLMVALGIAGASLGRSLNRRMDNKAVDILFMILLVVITLISTRNAIRFGASPAIPALFIGAAAASSFLKGKGSAKE